MTEKDTTIAYLLLIFLGLFGAHRFYIGKPISGIVYLFTLGLLGIGVIADLFTLAGQVRQRNMEIQVARMSGPRVAYQPQPYPQQPQS